MTQPVDDDVNAERPFRSAGLWLVLLALGWGCGSDSSAPPEETPPPAVSEEQPAEPVAEEVAPAEVAEVPVPAAVPAPAPRPDNPIDIFADKAASYLASEQAEDGSWPYFQSRTADFAEPEESGDVLGTMTILINLTETDLEASPMFERGVAYLVSQMAESRTWALAAGEASSEALQPEPDADRTSLGLTLLAGRFTIEPREVEEVRSLFGRHVTSEGLYRTYFDGFYAGKGFVPHENHPSIGVNLNVLGFFARFGLDRASLVEALEGAVGRERYWEETPFYRSLPLLAYLASNAVEHGAPEAEGLLRRFVADFAATAGQDKAFAEKLPSAELAAYVKARSRLCLLEQSPCRDLDMVVFELSKRRKHDGSWPIAPFYEHDVNPRAPASREAAHYYGGSPAETTSFALKALVLYRKLLVERPAFGAP